MGYRRLHFSKRHEIIASLSGLCSGLTYTCRHGLIKGMRRRGGLGFLPAFLAPVATAETRFLESLSIEGKVVYDIGAFEGLLTLFFARRAGQVIAYEPNPPSYGRLNTNVALNGLANVTARNLGLGGEPGMLRLAFDPLMPGAASGSGSVRGQIEATAKRTQTATVRVVRLDDDVRESRLPLPDLMKIDVEGMELAVLKGAEDILGGRPALYIELHGSDAEDKRANARAVLSFLWERGYRKLYDVEVGRFFLPEEADRPGHVYVTTQ